jgi:hypothetical protein
MSLRTELSSIALAALALLVLAGCSGSSGGSEAVPPSAPSGKIDVSYGVGGKATLDPTLGDATVDSTGSAYAVGESIAKLDPSGKLVPAYGEATYCCEHSPLLDAEGNLYTLSNGIVKRDANGHRVASFGSAGLAMIPPFSPSTGGTFIDLLRDPAGNLYTAWLRDDARPDAVSSRAMLVKVNASGQLDPAFGVAGEKDTGLDLPRSSQRPALALDGAGHVLMAGYLQSTLRFFVAEFDAQGNLVPDFGNGGIWQATEDCGTPLPVAIAALPSGELVAGSGCNGSAVIYKLDAKGVPVSAFNGGAARLAAGAVQALLAGPGGSVYMAGGLGTLGCMELGVWKLGTDGQLVAAFGDRGAVFPGLQSFAWNALALDGSGRLYAGAAELACPNPRLGAPAPYVIYRMSG